MEWIIPILALILGLAVLIIKLVRNARGRKCAGCPFEKTCPLEDRSDLGK